MPRDIVIIPKYDIIYTVLLSWETTPIYDITTSDFNHFAMIAAFSQGSKT